MPVRNDPNVSFPPARPRRGRRPHSKPSGKDALLRAAKVVFAECGFDRADLRTIARLAGVDPALVHVCFGGKDGLWMACIEGIQSQLRPHITRLRQRILSTDVPVVERLRDGIRMIATMNDDYPEIRQFVVQHDTESAERVRKLTDDLVRPIYEALKPAIAEAIEAGAVQAKHPVLFFHMLVQIINWTEAVPSVIHNLASEIAPIAVPDLIVENALLTLVPSATDAARRASPEADIE